MGAYRICLFIFIVSTGISLSGGDFVKDPPLTIIEYHPSGTNLSGKTIHQTITVWLTKELHK